MISYKICGRRLYGMKINGEVLCAVLNTLKNIKSIEKLRQAAHYMDLKKKSDALPLLMQLRIALLAYFLCDPSRVILLG